MFPACALGNKRIDYWTLNHRLAQAQRFTAASTGRRHRMACMQKIRSPLPGQTTNTCVHLTQTRSSSNAFIIYAINGAWVHTLTRHARPTIAMSTRRARQIPASRTHDWTALVLGWMLAINAPTFRWTRWCLCLQASRVRCAPL